MANEKEQRQERVGVVEEGREGVRISANVAYRYSQDTFLTVATSCMWPLKCKLAKTK